jgi:N-acetylglucosamine-6-phosphate deacetylase
VRRLAQWTGDPARAIAAATVVPRRVLGDDRSLPELLLGTPLVETLRWHNGPEGLSWRRPGPEATA